MNSLERRQDILEYLSIHRYATAKIFSERYDVTIRTIYSDIEILSLNYPIYTLQGENGGIRVDDGWKINNHILNSIQISFLKRFINSPRNSDKDKVIANSILNDFSTFRI